MDKKFFEKIVILLLPLIMILGVMKVISESNLIKAENSLFVDTEILENPENLLDTTNQEFLIELTAKEDTKLRLPFNSMITVLPITEEDVFIPIVEIGDEFDQSSFVVNDDKIYQIKRNSEEGEYYFKLDKDEKIRFVVENSSKDAYVLNIFETSETKEREQFIAEVASSEIFSEAEEEQTVEEIEESTTESSVVDETSTSSLQEVFPTEESLSKIEDSANLEIITPNEVLEESKTEESQTQEAEIETDKSEVEEQESKEYIGLANIATLDSPFSSFYLTHDNDKSEYLTGETATVRFNLTVSQGTGSLVNSVIEIRIKKEFLSGPPSGSEFQLAGRPTITEDAENYLIRYTVPGLSGGYTGSVPIQFTTQSGPTPSGYQLPIEASIYDSDGNELIAAEPISVTYETVTPRVTKHYYHSNGWPSTIYNNIIGGIADENDPTIFSSNLEDLVPMRYGFSISDANSNRVGSRAYEEFVITDTLPPGAVFIQEENPGWTYDEQSRVATYTAQLPGNTRTSTYLYTLDEDSILTLYYPGVKIGTNVTNNVSIESIPDDTLPGEPSVINTSSTRHGLRIAQRPGPMYATKSPYSRQVLDTLSEKEKEYGWTLNFRVPANDYDAAVENIVIRDYELDDRLYYSSIQVRGVTPNRGIAYKIEGRLADGTTRVVAERVTENIDFTLGEDLKDITITLLEGSVAANTNIYFNLFTKFKDPAGTTIESSGGNTTMSNRVEISGSYENDLGSFQARNIGSMELIPYQPTGAVAKQASGSITETFINDPITYQINVLAGAFTTGDSIENPIVVDLLPKGYEYIENETTVSGYGTQYTFADSVTQVEPEIIYNYQNTNRTALIWYLPDIVKTSIDNSSTDPIFAGTISYKAKATYLANNGVDQNDVYFSWGNFDEVTAVKAGSTRGQEPVADIYDINGNGDYTDLVAYDFTAINYRAPAEVISTKEVKGSLDPGYMFTERNGLTELDSTASYRISVVNNLADIENVELFDVLPFKGDLSFAKDDTGANTARNSTFRTELVGAVTVPENFTIFYTTDPPPDSDYDNYLQSASWTTTVSDYSTVRALKIVKDESEVFAIGDRLEIDVPIKIPKDFDLQNGDLAINSFGVNTNPVNTTPFYFESNLSPLEIVRYKVSGNVFADINANNLLDDNDSGIENYTVVLVDDAGNAVTDLDGQPITAQTDQDGFYEMQVDRTGDYRIKVLTPEDYELSTPSDLENGSQIMLDGQENLSDLFSLTADTRDVVRNAGYIPTKLAITLYKYKGETLQDVDSNDIIDDIDRKAADPLEGAIFEVYEGSEINPENQLKNDDGTPFMLVTDEFGIATFSGNTSQVYTLVEVQAPVGYELLKEPVTFTNVSPGAQELLWVYVSNTKNTELPFTGGNQVGLVLLIVATTTSLVGLAFVLYQFLPRKRRR